MDLLYVGYSIFFVVCVIEFIYKYTYLPNLRRLANEGYRGQGW
jgi:hypothetical protein